MRTRAASSFVCSLLMFLAIFPAPVAAKRALKTKRTRYLPSLLVAFPQLRISPEKNLWVNKLADEQKLPVIENDNDLQALTLTGFLIAVPSRTSSFIVADPGKCWEAGVREQFKLLTGPSFNYVSDLSDRYAALSGKPFRIASLLRTVEYQQWLTHCNRNAAAPQGPKRSFHLRGIAFDIAAKGMTPRELRTLGGLLAADVADGKVLVSYEYKRERAFHVVVLSGNFDTTMAQRDSR
jgi:hypothetical protein